MLRVGLVVVLAGAASAGCKADTDGKASTSAGAAATPPPGRFAGVAKKPAVPAAGRFCEKSYPSTGPDSRPYKPAPTRPLPVRGEAAPPAGPPAAGAWTWVNVWATWCAPCIDEMALLGRWRQGLKSAGTPIELELLSVDQTDSADALARVIGTGLPGPAKWLRSADDLDPFMASLGVAAGAALPVHALVDPAGSLRCVRVGAIHDRDYGAVKSLLAGG